jgi:LysR family transcriptional regulator, glycine cleavage system transcriptional activator
MSEKKSPFDSRIPPMNSLRVFEAAARHESFVRAADELHVTHGAVSRQIKQLEESLGVDLFDRRNRAVFLTPRGKILLEACTQAMERLTEALRQVKAPTVELPLVLSCEPTIAMRWLIPRLPAFRERFPQHQIHLLTAGGPVDFARDRVDLALRRNDFNTRIDGAGCTPSVALAMASDLPASRKHKLLHSRTRPSAWQRWFDVGGHSPEAAGSEHFEHFCLSLQAAGAGLGMTIGSAYMVEEDLRDERLVAPFGFLPDGSEYVLLSPTPFRGDTRRMLFLDWLRHEMGRSRHGVESLIDAA